MMMNKISKHIVTQQQTHNEETLEMLEIAGKVFECVSGWFSFANSKINWKYRFFQLVSDCINLIEMLVPYNPVDYRVYCIHLFH